MIKRLFIYLTIVMFSLASEGAERTKSISQIIGQPSQKSVEFSILAVQAKDGKVLYSRNAEKSMIPASNMKVISSAAALHYLGSEYQFQTQLAMLGNSVVVIGGGDPLLGDTQVDQRYGRKPGWIFQEIVHVLQERGITAVDDVIVDSFFFDQNRVHPAWPADQLNQWYACEISGINYNRNCVRITASRQGERVMLAMEPQNDYVTLINQVRQINKGNSALGAYRSAVPNNLIIKGNLNKQAGFDVAIERPAGLFANVLARSVNQAGITVNGQVVQKYISGEPGLVILKTFPSPIWDTLNRCNKDSLGLAAECLIKTISAENTKGRINGEWPHGLTLVGRYLNSLGLSDTQFHLDDGSGLSRNNRLSCKVLVAVLRQIYQKPYADRFMTTLAEAGVDGTIQKYFHQAPYRGNILGKTGYIAGVRTFSGICRTPRGDIIFSILTAGGSSATRQSINDITKAIFDGTF